MLYFACPFGIVNKWRRGRSKDCAGKELHLYGTEDREIFTSIMSFHFGSLFDVCPCKMMKKY